VIAEIWHYRGWIWDSALSDLRHRYAGSGLGIFWNVVNPLLMLGLYVFIFTRVLIPRFSGANSSLLFPLYLSAGFLPWITFADGIVRSTQSLVTNAVHLKRVALPETVFVAQASVSTMLSMFIAVALLPLLALFLGQEPSWTWLLLPLVIILWQAFGFGIGLALGTINVFFRDVSQILIVLLQVWMWSVPIVYVEDMVPEPYRGILPFNPAYPFVTALRGAVMDSVAPAWIWAAMVGWAALAIAIGLGVMFRLRSEVRDSV
jgi:ABC-type polysaccharide/polyol phosphate export permease